ncbi:hypothetical protein [Sphingomonas sp.]|uniref:hypothetical protein n=1 Tax=Sphingomonas sp. TaxID=28214 RepID=UPI0025EA6813|nr:hypothetical protein [Sphingomonas sp.]
MTTRAFLLTVTACVIASSSGAQAKSRTEVRPYLEIDQTVFGDLQNGGSSAYTTVAAGIDASINTERTEGQITYRYEHRFGWDKDLGDSDVHSGLARGQYALVPNLLKIEAGALATRTRTDIAGVAANPVIGNPDNVSQLYSIYAGPTLATQLGAFNVGAAYRFGYTHVENRLHGGSGQSGIGAFDSSTSHVAGANIGMNVGVLPFGWNVSGGYEREDSNELDQRFESAFGRADVTVPISPTVAAVGGVGYEKIKSSERDALRDINGDAIVDGGGHFVTDPNSPRLLAYDQSGFIWDAGILWRPSPRTSLEARVGRRYGSMTYTGAFSYQPYDNMAFQVRVYDGIQTFGRQINSALSSLPTQFTIQRNPFGSALGGCVFGAAGGGAGRCLNDALQSVASSVYRSRGIDGVWRYTRGPWFAGLGIGYTERTFLAEQGVLATVNGLKDRSYYAQANVSRRLTSHSGVDGTVYISWFEPGLAGTADVIGTGASGSYFYNFNNHLSGTASLGVFSTRVEDVDSSLTGAAQLSARYQF